MGWKRVSYFTAFVLIVLVCLLAQSARAAMFQVSGTSGKGTEVSFSAELAIDVDNVDILTVTLRNTSDASFHPDDVLASFYFDILNESGQRPSLGYISALGDVYLGVKGAPDTPQGSTSLMPSVTPETWQFKTMDPDVFPNLGFGIGTVGNNGLNPNGFNGNVTGGRNYSIYAGDVETQNLDGVKLVLEEAVFTFEGVSGFTEADISPITLFGLGTAPDSYLVTPVPGSLLLGGLGLGMAGWRLRRRCS